MWCCVGDAQKTQNNAATPKLAQHAPTQIPIKTFRLITVASRRCDLLVRCCVLNVIYLRVYTQLNLYIPCFWGSFGGGGRIVCQGCATQSYMFAARRRVVIWRFVDGTSDTAGNLFICIRDLAKLLRPHKKMMG